MRGSAELLWVMMLGSELGARAAGGAVADRLLRVVAGGLLPVLNLYIQLYARALIAPWGAERGGKRVHLQAKSGQSQAGR